MDVVNAIAKVRFGSVRPQRVQLSKGEAFQAELLCMEPGQQVSVASGQWLYYVITGSAELAAGGRTTELPPGQFAASAPDEEHTLSAAGDRRLVCLVFRHCA